MQRLVQHTIFILLLYKWRTSTASSSSPEIAQKNCTSLCGGVQIPYPFGIGPNNHCYFDGWFEIECRNSIDFQFFNSSVPETPFLRRLQLEVLSISIVNATLQVLSPVTFFSCKRKKSPPAPNLTASPFSYATDDHNTFFAVSCGLFASMRTAGPPNHTVAGCASTCSSTTPLTNESCGYGINCCRTTLSQYVTSFSVMQEQDETRRNAMDCKDYAFLVDQKWYDTHIPNVSYVKDMEFVPVELDWSLSLEKNKSLIKSFEAFNMTDWRNLTDSRPLCERVDPDPLFNRTWYSCTCPEGFEGNPYLLQPCRDIDECKDNNPCVGLDLHTTTTWNISNAKCNNTVGGHTCYSTRTGETCELFAFGVAKCYSKNRPHSQLKPILSGLGAGIGLLLLLSGAWWIYKFAKKWNNNKLKQMFYKRNGGLLLEQQLSSGDINIERIKLFESKELQRSTDNFNAERIIGQGGQGTVYKGMLMDGRIVAVKKSKMVDEAKLSEFINEVVILSQINHRNIVQLLGCCLETEVPLLVYEFIPNGNLSQYIHEQSEEFPLTWEIRLRIATEIAGALAYLHTSTLFPIFHRDIKSTNILLDDKYRAKIADFGTSRLVAIDQTHLTTRVHGTFGYLDPEYYQTSQFTEKSDVYSFGVVLVELLTGKKPVTRSDEDEMYKSLASYFIVSMQEDSLFDILDARVVNEGSKDGILRVANLARRCLGLNGRKRPTMREVTTELEVIQLSEKPTGAQENCESLEVEQDYQIEQWDDVFSGSTTMSTWKGAPSTSSVELRRLFEKTC
ncbi:PREDICTED: putative wall-associated receptor kinase-like 13-like [Fragaria vesca subsp. vesca]